MEDRALVDKQYRMLKSISDLPRKILQHHYTDNVAECVLYELCHEHCFNLNKAAYFIDNPDFNCTRGITGFSREESYSQPSIWQDVTHFSQFMKDSAFNKKVREINRCSLKKIEDSHEVLAREIAQELGFKNYGVCEWQMKHDNHGFLIYEKASTTDNYADEFLVSGLALLGFCPIH